MRNTFTIGLCDDESFIFDDLEQLVRQYGLSKGQNFNFVYFSSAEQLLHLQPCKTTALAEPSASVLMVPHPDILFLDIDMPGKDGIAIGKELRQRKDPCLIIMLTGHQERVKDAFKINAFRFATKPIDKSEITEYLDEALTHLSFSSCVPVHMQGQIIQISQRKICCIETAHSASTVITNKREFHSENSLAAWIKILDPNFFFQCHKSYIVNLDQIEQIKHTEIILKNGYRACVSRRLYSSLKQAFITYDTKWRG